MHRRQFCINTLGALALPAVAARASAAEPRIRIGQIGTAHAHAAGKMSAMRELAEDFEVVGIVENDPQQKATAEGNEAYAGLQWLDESKLLVQPNLAAVAVETQVEQSAATALRCIQAGKHVHLDKPGALDHPSFKSMRLEAERKGLAVQMGYMLRYNPAFELLFRAVREGWLGDILEIDAAMGKLADAGTRKSIGALPGGGMFELGCHVIDAVVTLLGRPNSVDAVSTPSRDDGVLDNQLAVLKYAKCSATIRCNHADPFGGPRRRFSVTGTGGTFEILPLESGKVNLSLAQAQGGFKKGSQALQLAVPKGRYNGEFADLAKVIRGKKPLAWDAAHDITVHETVLRAAGVWEETAGARK